MEACRGKDSVAVTRARCELMEMRCSRVVKFYGHNLDEHERKLAVATCRHLIGGACGSLRYFVRTVKEYVLI